MPPGYIGAQRELNQSVADWRPRSEALLLIQSALETMNSSLADADIWQHIGRIATRVAVILLIVFLVQIIVNLYRYSMRLSGYYRARGDVISLMRADPGYKLMRISDMNLSELVETFSPDQVAFDKSPPSQIQSITDAAKGQP